MKHGVERDDWIVGGLAALLLIALLAFPWWTRMPAASGSAVQEVRPAVQAPYAWAALIAILALAWLLFDLGMQRFLPDKKIPTLRDGRTTRFVMALVAAVFVAVKLLLHLSNLAWGFVFAVVLALALVFAAGQVSRGGSVVPNRLWTSGRRGSASAS